MLPTRGNLMEEYLKARLVFSLFGQHLAQQSPGHE